MSMFTLRISPEDEIHLEILSKVWGMSRSAAARKAIEDAAAREKKTGKSKMAILQQHGLIGSYSDSDTQSTKSKVKSSLKKKYGRK